VGWWRFDEGAGTTAADSSGYGSNGTVLGNPNWVSGKRGGALSFDGSTSRVDVPDATSLEPTSAVSVAAWVNATGTQGPFKYILAKGATQCIAASYGLYTGANGGLIFYVSNNSGLTYSLSPDAGTGVWDGTWHFVVGTYDGATVKLYVDGVQVASGTPFTGAVGYGMTNGNDLFIGHYDGCPDHDFAGLIDEPQVWSRALSPSDITALMSPYSFTGFFQPISNMPVENVIKAGSSIPIKFSLGGNFGLGIVAAGSPSSHLVNCASGATLDTDVATVTAGASSLQYDVSSDQYTYVWKTATGTGWASGQCRQLDVMLTDGTTHSAVFKFR